MYHSFLGIYIKPSDPMEYVWFFTLHHSHFCAIFYAPFRQICVISSWESKFRWEVSSCSDAYGPYKCFYETLTQQNGLNCPDHIKNQSGVHLSWRVHLCWIYPIGLHYYFVSCEIGSVIYTIMEKQNRIDRKLGSWTKFDIV